MNVPESTLTTSEFPFERSLVENSLQAKTYTIWFENSVRIMNASEIR